MKKKKIELAVISKRFNEARYPELPQRRGQRPHILWRNSSFQKENRILDGLPKHEKYEINSKKSENEDLQNSINKNNEEIISIGIKDIKITWAPHFLAICKIRSDLTVNVMSGTSHDISKMIHLR